MFTKPECGWTNVQIDDFTEQASYLTDIPIDCLEAFINALNNHLPAAVEFDGEEVGQYMLVANNSDSYIITEGKELRIFDKTKLEIAKEIFNDFKTHFDDWCGWGYSEDYRENNTSVIQQKLNELECAIKEFEKRYNQHINFFSKE
jgi:hypothetical protein